MSWYFVLLGALGLVFRYWIANYKLNHLLKHRTGHLSRMVTYFFFIAMMTDFGQNIFTLIIVGALPTMIGAFLMFDVSFYRHIFTKDWSLRLGVPEAKPKERFWIFLERFTLHWPAIVPGIVIYYRDPREFFLPFMDFQTVVIASVMMIIAFFLLDPRWWKIEPNGQRNDHPAGTIILPSMVASMLGLFIYLYLDFDFITSSIQNLLHF